MAFGLSSLTSFFKADLGGLSKKSSVIGIDVGSSAIKIVQLRNERGVPTLETYGELQLGPYEGVDLGRGTHLTQTKSIEALVDILRESGATGTESAFAFAYNASFISMVSIPTVDPERIPMMVPIEAKKYIPIALSKVTIDWFPVSAHEEEGRTDVLVSAIYNETLERYDGVMKGAGLTPVASEIEIFSSIRSVLSPKDTAVAIIDCGASSTRLYIVRNGIVGKTHSVPLSGVELTESLASARGTEFKLAEEEKRRVGIRAREEESDIEKTLRTALGRGFREMHTVISRYEAGEGITLEKVILSGGGALLEGLQPYAEDLFAHKVELANPFSKVAYPAFLEDTLKVAGPSFAVAVGIALRAYKRE